MDRGDFIRRLAATRSRSLFTGVVSKISDDPHLATSASTGDPTLPSEYHRLSRSILSPPSPARLAKHSLLATLRILHLPRERKRLRMLQRMTKTLSQPSRSSRSQRCLLLSSLWPFATICMTRTLLAQNSRVFGRQKSFRGLVNVLDSNRRRGFGMSSALSCLFPKRFRRKPY